MDDDRKLLEMAAEAAGMEYEFRHGQHKAIDRAVGEWHRWNPLEDDGDALRLAVKLRLDLDFDLDNPLVEVYRQHHTEGSQVFCEHSAPEGVRRAIVRAAAALKEKP